MFKRLRKKHNERKANGKNSNSLKTAHAPYSELLKEGVVAGLGWAFGVTIGFVIISAILVIVLKVLGGLPVVGGWIASVVEATQVQLLKRTPFISQ